ncbi:MAG: alpha-ketoacid dehydrogenase subunit beta [Dehalococcoidales bacterium]|nr:MAG: alpha-ketoacid dehydrogenase subunit beta [Dehalococcoidales bacterium]
MRKINYTQATVEALQEEFRRDDTLIHLAEDIPAFLYEEFGADRIRMTPISESAFVGAAIGAAGSGFRTVADLRMATFAFCAFDQFVNQAAKITYMFGGQAKFPILYRMRNGLGASAAAQHSVNPYSMYMNVAGLKILIPSTPYDAKGLLKAAIRDNNPVISFEHMELGRVQGEVPEEEYIVPLGEAAIMKEGTDVTVVAMSLIVYEALAAAEEAEKDGISVELIDPRTLVPLDVKAIRNSVAKTGRIVVVDEANQTCSAACEILSLVVEDDDTFSRLKAPAKRVCGLDVPVPFSPPMEKFAIPDKDKILAAVRQVINYNK